jgi:hypothetical protein
MIEEDIKQTRCTTCDAEHAYKGARVPARRKKESSSALYKEVLAGMPELDAPVLAASSSTVVAFAPVALVPAVDAIEDVVSLDPPINRSAEDFDTPMHNHNDDDIAPQDAFEAEPPRVDEPPAVDGPVHRPLIRATLPRPEGQKDARPLPEFTIRQTPSRGNQYGGGNVRGERVRMRAGAGSGAGHGGPNGNRAQGSGSRFHGNRPSGQGRPSSGRSGGSPGFRGGNSGSSGKRGRGPRG